MSFVKTLMPFNMPRRAFTTLRKRGLQSFNMKAAAGPRPVAQHCQAAQALSPRRDFSSLRAFKRTDLQDVVHWFTEDLVQPPTLLKSIKTFVELCILRNMNVVQAPEFIDGARQAFMVIHELLLKNDMEGLQDLVEKDCLIHMKASMKDFEDEGYTFVLNPRDLPDTPLDISTNEVFISDVAIQSLDYQYDEDAEEVLGFKVHVHVNVGLKTTERFQMLGEDGKVVDGGAEPRYKLNIWQFAGTHHSVTDSKSKVEPLKWRLANLDTSDYIPEAKDEDPKDAGTKEKAASDEA